MRGLYVHVPFCVKKCSYCDFYSLPSRLDSLEGYVQAILREAELYAGMTFDTLYIGGGTPSLLGAKHLKMLIDGLKKTFNFSSNNATCHCECNEAISERGGHSTLRLPRADDPNALNDKRKYEATIEINPESATQEFLHAVKETGFTRVSFGVQSLSDNELRSVGRIHTAEQAVEAIKLAKKLGFEAISADLIIGLPGQTWTSLQKSLSPLVELEVRHLSVYCLALEEGTILRNKPPADLPTDDMQVSLYKETKKFLNTCGYAHYEISNFTVRGYECRHNLNYWRGGEYLGLGAAAASHLEGKRWRNKADLDAYISNPTGQIEEIEVLGIEEKAAEEAMLRLRLLKEGLDIISLADKYGKDNIADLFKRLESLKQDDMLMRNFSVYFLAPDMEMISNRVFTRVIES